MEIDISLPNNQRQHRTLHIQKDVLPCALCYSLCPVTGSLAADTATILQHVSHGQPPPFLHQRSVPTQIKDCVVLFYDSIYQYYC